MFAWSLSAACRASSSATTGSVPSTDQFQPATSLFPGLLKVQFAIDAQLPPCGVLVAGIAGHQNKGSTPCLGDADA